MELLEIKNIKSEIKYSLVLINNMLGASEKKTKWIQERCSNKATIKYRAMLRTEQGFGEQ